MLRSVRIKNRNVFTSDRLPAASIVVASNVDWQFNKGLAISGGYTVFCNTTESLMFAPTSRNVNVTPERHAEMMEVRHVRQRASHATFPDSASWACKGAPRGGAPIQFTRALRIGRDLSVCHGATVALINSQRLVAGI